MLKIAAREIKAFEVPFNEKVVIYSMQTSWNYVKIYFLKLGNFKLTFKVVLFLCYCSYTLFHANQILG